MKKLGILLLLLLFISGCGFLNDDNEDAKQEETEENDSDDRKDDASSDEAELVEGEEVDPDEDQELPDTPSNFKDAVDYPITGEFAGESYEENQEEIEKS